MIMSRDAAELRRLGVVCAIRAGTGRSCSVGKADARLS